VNFWLRTKRIPTAIEFTWYDSLQFFSVRVKKPLRVLIVEGGNGKIDEDGYTDNRVPEMFRELDQALA